MEATHREPRPAPRERVAGLPHVDITHSPAAGQLAVTIHVDVPDGFVLPGDFSTNVAKGIAALLAPKDKSK